LRTTQLQEIGVMDRIRAEVATAYARTHAEYAQLLTYEQAVQSAMQGFKADLTRAQGAVGLPLEVLDSLRLLATARFDYLGAIVDYNRAQFELYVSLGQPPADALARPVPTAGVVLPGQPIPSSPDSSTLPPNRPAGLDNRPAALRSNARSDGAIAAGERRASGP
jgi:hypothetical protein